MFEPMATNVVTPYNPVHVLGKLTENETDSSTTVILAIGGFGKVDADELADVVRAAMSQYFDGYIA